MSGIELETMRGPFPGLEEVPPGLQSALVEFDGLRSSHGRDVSAWPKLEKSYELTRLQNGLYTLTKRSIMAMVRAERHHICPFYVSSHLRTLTRLDGLFWWNDGEGALRRRILLCAWRKGMAA